MLRTLARVSASVTEVSAWSRLSLHGRSKVNRVRKRIAVQSVWVEVAYLGHAADPMRLEEGLHTRNPLCKDLHTNLFLRYISVGFFSVPVATSQLQISFSTSCYLTVSAYPPVDSRSPIVSAQNCVGPQSTVTVFRTNTNGSSKIQWEISYT